MPLFDALEEEGVKANTMGEHSRAFVIGLDGGNLGLLKRLAQEGHMPFFSSLIRQGVCGELRSISPPSTPPAWTTFMTGKNPGKHGVFDFFSYKNDLTPPRVVNSTFIRSATLWSILSEAGKRIGVVNVPMTYPPQPVNGVMMTGLLTPSTDLEFCYPASLYGELRRELGEFLIEVPWRDYVPERIPELFDALAHCSRQREKYVRALMLREPWDFFMVVFSETDSLQHALWSFLDQNDARHADMEIQKRAQGYFRLLDGILEELCSLAGQDTRIFFMSDHGIGPLLKWVHMNTWLQCLGLLSLDPKRLLAMRGVKWFAEAVMRLDRHGWRKKLPFVPKASSDPASILRCIRWNRTKAFVALSGEQGIRINLRGREPHGIVSPGREYEELRDQILMELRRLRDPETGEVVGTFARRREEVYAGQFMEQAPDIVFLLGEGRYVGDAFPGYPIFERTNWKHGMGTHRMEGLFLAVGPGIRTGQEVKGACIEDMLPTLLYTLKQPIPASCDGKVLSDIFREEYLAGARPHYSESEWGAAEERDDFSEDEERDIIEKLRSLGYVD